jgi:hypothetical protein
VASRSASSERSAGSPGSVEPGASPRTTRVAGMSDWSSSRAAPAQGGARLVVRASTAREPIESVEAVGFGAMSVAAVSVEAPRLRKHDEAEAFSVSGDGDGDGGGGGVGGAEEHGAASASEDAHGGRRSGRSGGVERPESGAESAGTHATNVGLGIGLVERLLPLPCAPVLSVMPVLPV